MIDISELLSFEKIGVRNWLDRLRFSHIFLVWMCMVVLYGLFYYYFTNSVNYLYDTLNYAHIHNVWESLYFSFVTATTTGFGDIVPIGSFKAIAIAEVITGLLVLAVVTSKFVSIKQDQIMKELYDISINEKISRLRSALFLYKQHLHRLSSNAQEGKFKKFDIKNLGMYFSNYEDVLVESLTLIAKEDETVDSIMDLDLDLLERSIVDSAKKTHEAGEIFSDHKISWSKNNEDVLAIIADLNDEVNKNFKKSSSINDSTKRYISKSLRKSSNYLREVSLKK